LRGLADGRLLDFEQKFAADEIGGFSLKWQKKASFLNKTGLFL
jgi:hypothetical protein